MYVVRMSYTLSMARTSSNRLLNRTVRARLDIQPKEPHWHQIVEGQHLGYRKTGERRGTWVVRYYTPKHGRRFKALGMADDTAPANGTHILGYEQAVEALQKWVAEVAYADNAGIHYGPYRVKDAAAAWIDGWSGSEAGKSNAESNLKYHILPTLGDIEVAKLTRHQIQDWLIQLAKKPPVKVQQRQASQKKLPPSRQSKIVYNPNDPETIRKRQDTANRIFNDLSALLTLAYDNQRVASKAAWETVEKFEGVGTAKNQYLTLEEAKKFLEVCPQDFRDLVQAALITGCRYGELAGLKVSAYDVQIRAISLIQGKTRKRKTVYLTEHEAAFFNRHIEGKQHDELLFRRDDGERWAKSNQQPRMKAVLKAAGVSRHVRFHDLRHTFATLLVMNGTSIQVIANQLGHSGTRVAEEHYAHFSPAYVANTVRANKPNFAA